MGLHAEKLKLIQLLLNTENPSIIKQVKAIFQSNEESDLWLDLSKEQQEAIEKSIQESIDGLTVDYNDFLSQHKQ